MYAWFSHKAVSGMLFVWNLYPLVSYLEENKRCGGAQQQDKATGQVGSNTKKPHATGPSVKT